MRFDRARAGQLPEGSISPRPGPVLPYSKPEEDPMDTRQSPYHQKAQDVKSPLSSKSLRLAYIVSFIVAVTFIIIGMLVCILNIIDIIHGPWAAIIGVLFAGTGLIMAFYTLFIRRAQRGGTRDTMKL